MNIHLGWRTSVVPPRRVTARLGDHVLLGMFEGTASTYDLQNRLLSLGRDRHWRRVFVRRLRPAPGGQVGDLATGTGDVALETCARYPGVHVVGVDVSRGMMRVARRKIRARGLAHRVELRAGDLRSLPLSARSLDAVTLCFGIRNILERGNVLAECHRVLKPGGLLQVMEMARPGPGLFGVLYRVYFDRVVPVAGALLSGIWYAYDYLVRSVHAFPTDEQFLLEMSGAGFVRTRATPITLGTARIYRGRKAVSP
jgi:demethylmenaquinone methyltransferase/2-methoxy-6-polyprenyl-1,4-benzoquinol methylase